MSHVLSFKLWESFNLGMRYPSKVNINDHEKEIIKDKITWRDLDWKEIGNDGNSIIWLELILPIELNISKGVIVDIQLIQDTFYQIHINLTNELQGLGLGTKIYRSIVEWAGHLYSGKGRRHNPIINDVWNKLRKDHGVKCMSNDIADICISKENPNIKGLTDLFKSM